MQGVQARIDIPPAMSGMQLSEWACRPAFEFLPAAPPPAAAAASVAPSPAAVAPGPPHRARDRCLGARAWDATRLAEASRDATPLFRVISGTRSACAMLLMSGQRESEVLKGTRPCNVGRSSGILPVRIVKKLLFLGRNDSQNPDRP